MNKPVILIIGPLVGKNPGYNPTLGEILAKALSESGYDVITSSTKKNRFLRLFDICFTILRESSRFDCAIIQMYGRNSFIVEDIASWMCKKEGKKIILHLHGGSLPDFFGKHPRWSRRVLKRANNLVVPSPYLLKALVSMGHHPVIISNPLELDKYPFRLRKRVRPRLLWMRAFHENYNPEMAIRVLARLKELISDAELVMAGQDKGLLDKMQRLAHELHVEKSIFFPGVMNMDAKILEANKSDIFINTSRIDNAPVSVLEACAFGMPVVTTDVGGIPQFIKNGETGLLVDSNNVEAMVQSILAIVRDPDIAARLSQNGRRFAEASGWQNLEKLWQDLLIPITK